MLRNKNLLMEITYNAKDAAQKNKTAWSTHTQSSIAFLIEVTTNGKILKAASQVLMLFNIKYQTKNS